MKWSWKIGQVAGIGVFVHSTFLILLAWIGLSYWQSEHSAVAVAEGIGFILALFGCVLLHELGHALAAQRYGIATRDITLLPIGGLARLERMPEEPRQEMVVAVAGPLVNVVIAIALFAGMAVSGGLGTVDSITMTEGSFIARLMWVNVILVVFNMIPAFPMDGGRVLRAFLATRMEYSVATQKAASIGQFIALVFGFLGLIANPFLIFIALFVWIGAAQEAAMVQLKATIGGILVRSAMLTDFRTLAPEDTLGEAVRLTLAGSQKDFPVVERGAVIGVLTQSNLLTALTKQGPDTAVAAVMQPGTENVAPDDPLQAVLERLEQNTSQSMPVTESGELIGIITLDNISELIRIQTALNEAKSLAA